MTIEELYLWAEANGYENYDIETMDYDGEYRLVGLSDVEIDDSSILL